MPAARGPKRTAANKVGKERDRHLRRSRDPDAASLGHGVDDDQGKDRPRIAAERVASERAAQRRARRPRR